MFGEEHRQLVDNSYEWTWCAWCGRHKKEAQYCVIARCWNSNSGWSWEGIEPRVWTLNGLALAKGLIRGLTAALTALI